MVDGEVRGLLTLSVFTCQWVWDDHQVVNFFRLVMVLASVKQLRGCASDSAIWVLQKGAIAEDMGKEVCPGKAPQDPSQLQSQCNGTRRLWPFKGIDGIESSQEPGKERGKLQLAYLLLLTIL